ncbi:MAG: hypothetical protein FWE68_01405 [Defluviitaleaceae bacterium]|nr:hypothetical protein [Defluviitaleaceae bacterium]
MSVASTTHSTPIRKPRADGDLKAPPAWNARAGTHSPAAAEMCVNEDSAPLARGRGDM